MKSAAEYPEYQSDPDNIQFLTRDEHLEAHKGSWTNPTNWYYNPETKDFLDFDNGKIIPCKIIELTDSIISTKISDVNKRSNTFEESQKAEKSEEASSGKADVNPSPSRKKQNHTVVKNNTSQEKSSIAKSTKKNKLVKGLKNVGEFVVEHPVVSLEIAGVIIASAVKGGRSVLYSKKSSKRNINSTNPNTNSASPIRSDIITQVVDIVKKTKRSSPKEHTVASHKQHYHTKDGLILKEKKAYPRGGKKN